MRKLLTVLLFVPAVGNCGRSVGICVDSSRVDSKAVQVQNLYHLADSEDKKARLYATTATTGTISWQQPENDGSPKQVSLEWKVEDGEFQINQENSKEASYCLVKDNRGHYSLAIGTDTCCCASGYWIAQSSASSSEVQSSTPTTSSSDPERQDQWDLP